MKGSKRRRTQRKEVEIVHVNKDKENKDKENRDKGDDTYTVLFNGLQHEFETLQSERTAFRDQLRSTSSLLIETGTECAELQKQKEELQKQNEELQQQKEELKVYIKEISATIVLREQQKGVLKLQYDELKQQYDELDAQNELNNKQCAEYRKRLDDLEVCSCCVCDKKEHLVASSCGHTMCTGCMVSHVAVKVGGGYEANCPVCRYPEFIQEFKHIERGTTRNMLKNILGLGTEISL